MSIIVLEGPDLAGKTTLAQQLMRVNDGRGKTYIKRGPIREDPMLEYLRPLDALCSSNYTDMHQCLVLDRWHVGELIYGPLLRGRSQLTVPQANYIEMVMQSLGCIFIHVTSDVPTLQDRYDIRGDSLIKKEWLEQIQEDYWRYVSTRPHWVSYAVSHESEWHSKWSRPPEPSAPNFVGRYIGPSRPSVLLLGDERASDEFTWPFVPRRATSGHWLMGALVAAEIDHMQVGIVNACELQPAELHLLYGQLGWPPVVTLGRNAERAWKASWSIETRPFIYLHHPQYARRFHYMSFKTYGEQIKAAITSG